MWIWIKPWSRLLVRFFSSSQVHCKLNLKFYCRYILVVTFVVCQCHEIPFTLVASCIKKHDYVAQWGTDGNPCSKQTNSAGLQLADMVARPIGRHLIDPTQSNRAFDTLEKKLRRNSQGKVQGLGLKVYP
jgi:hypothetical protein